MPSPGFQVGHLSASLLVVHKAELESQIAELPDLNQPTRMETDFVESFNPVAPHLGQGGAHGKATAEHPWPGVVLGAAGSRHQQRKQEGEKPVHGETGMDMACKTMPSDPVSTAISSELSAAHSGFH